MNSLPPEGATTPANVVVQTTVAPAPAGQTASGAAVDGASSVPRISSEQLFPTGAAELIIDHRGALYRLKQTSLGKLILTK